MKNGQYVWVVAVGLVCWPLAAHAAEHGGKTMEHGGQSMPSDAGSATPAASATTSTPAAPSTTSTPAAPEAAAPASPAAEPTAEQIRQAIRTHIDDITAAEGAFTVEDEQAEKTRTLQLVRVHERVGKTGAAYYSCTDMKDTASNELLDLDFDVEQVGDQLIVTDTRIHKVNGQERYTYDTNNNRVPVAGAAPSTPAPAESDAN